MPLICETISLSHRLPCINLWRTRLALSPLWNNLLCAAGLSAKGAILDVLPPPACRRPYLDSDHRALPLYAQGGQRDTKPSESGAMPPKTWVDRDTGHRVWRVSDEPNSGAFYFNVNAYTPDHKQMVYNSPDGIRVLDLATMTTRMLIPNQPPPAAPAGTGAAAASAAERARLSSAARPTASSSRGWTRQHA